MIRRSTLWNTAKILNLKRIKCNIRFSQLEVIDDLENSSYKKADEKITQIRNNDKRIKDNYVSQRAMGTLMSPRI